jgi:hypothetical protein
MSRSYQASRGNGDAFVGRIAERGLAAEEREADANGVRKAA